MYKGRGWRLLRAVGIVNLRHFRRQPLRTGLAVVALGAGTSLAMAVLVEAQSFNSSLAAYYKTLSGPAPLRVLGAAARGGLDQAELASVRSVPGVAHAIPMVQAVTLAQRVDGSQVAVVALGVDCSVQAIVGNLGCSEAALHQATTTTPPVISARLARSVGPQAVIRTDEGPVGLSGAISASQLDRVNQGRVAVFALPAAQSLFGRTGRLDVIYVEPAPGVNLDALWSRLARAVGPQAAVLPAGSPPPGAQLAEAFLPELAMVSLFALAVGGILILNILSLSLAERRRELAIVGAVGGSARLIAGGALTEAALLGASGGLLGAAGGAAVAIPMIANASGLTQKFLGLTLTLHVSLRLVAAAVLLGVALSVISALIPVRRAIRLDLPAELHDRSSDADQPAQSRLKSALAAVAMVGAGLSLRHLAQAGGGLESAQPLEAAIGLLVAAVGVTAFVAATTPIVLNGVHRIASRGSGTAAVAVTNLARDPNRSATVCVAIAFAVGMATVLASLIPAIHDTTAAFSSRVLLGRVYVSTVSNANAATIDADLPAVSVDRLSRLPGVAGLQEELFVATADRGGHLVGVDTNGFSEPPPFKFLSGRVAEKPLGADQAYAGSALARQDHLRAGSVITLRGLHGLTPVRIVAVWQNPDTNGYALTMSPAAITEIWGSQPPLDVLLKPAPGVSAETLADEVRALHLDRNVQILTPAAYVRELSDTITANLAPFWAMQRALMIVAFVATLSTLLLAGIQRRRQLGLLAAVGLGPTRLARMTFVEAAVLGLVGSAFGLVAGAVLLDALLADAMFVVGVVPPYRLSVAPAMTYSAIAVAVVLVGAALPAWRAARLPVLTALRTE